MTVRKRIPRLGKHRKEPDFGTKWPEVRGNHKYLLLALAPLIKITAIVPCKHFRGTFDFYALGLDKARIMPYNV